MACTSRIVRTLFFATLAIASTALTEECSDEATCESVGEPGSALIQTKKNAQGSKINIAGQIGAPLAPAHMVDSRACIPQPLQEASISALRHHASLLSTGARKAVRTLPATTSMNACTDKSANDECSLTMNGIPVPGVCTLYGMDNQLHCEIGQFKSCGQTPQGSTNTACDVFGMTGTCVGVTGYPIFDNFNNFAGTNQIYMCDLAWQSTLDPSLLPGATPAPTEPPTPVPETPAPTEPPTPEPQPDTPAPTQLPQPKPDTGFAATGSSASLDAAGFKAVTSLCCAPEMELFFNRLLDSMGLQVCSKPHIQGLMHWFTCVPDMDFQYVLDVINNGNPCKYWAAKGAECPVLTPQCKGNWCR